MREEDLDELLPRLRQRGKDQVAGNFEVAVLRKIRVRKGPVPWSFCQIVIAFLRPSWVLSAMILAGLIGVVTGAITQEKRDKSKPLGLNAFSLQAPALPSTVLRQIK